MTFESGPEYDASTAHQVQTAAQEAVTATETAYTSDVSLDVAERLRTELSERGLEVDDDAWIAEVAHQIRSGHHIVLDDPNRPGSVGGDHGGG